ncbi:glycosyltransferase family 4 protein [Thalassovita mediterranea]|nr:glycosyltransferase family 4 protein [Thalassovita mediterranea]
MLALLPSIPLGGMERAALRVMQEMSARGADVHVLTNRRWGETVQSAVDDANLKQSGICHIHSLGLPKTPIEWRAAFISFLMSERELADAHRRHGANCLLAPSLNAAWFARRLARRPDTVSVFRIPNPPDVTRQGVRAAINYRLWRAVGASFDHLICNSNYTAGIVAQVSGGHNNVRVVRNFRPDLNRRIARPAPPLPKDRRRVIYLGQISSQKGVDILFETAKLLVSSRDDIDFVLAGPKLYLDSYSRELENRIVDAQLGDRFRLIGVVDDVHELLRQGDVHVCPSISPGDSFPNVVLDAKQAGLPSVVLPTAGLPETVENDVDGIVTEDHTPEALAAALRLLLDDPERRQEMGKAAHASLHRFDPDILSATWLELFSTKTNLKPN